MIDIIIPSQDTSIFNPTNNNEIKDNDAPLEINARFYGRIQYNL